MSTVTVNIGPKSYTIACADGEEAHIEGLGAMIAEKYALLGASRAPLEAQNLLFAALFLADELAEARKRKPSKSAAKSEPPAQADTAEADALRQTIAKLEAELEAARQTRSSAPAPASKAPQSDLFGSPAQADDLAEQLEVLAERVEASAAALEAAAASA